MEYAGKTAVVTGAASGIGRALALELVRRGAQVAVSDIDEAELARTVELAGRQGGDQVRSYALDVADRAAFLAHAEDVARDFGQVNLVVNNAGVAVAATALEMTFDDLDWLLGINLLGVITGSKAFLPHLIASGDGHLVNLSSVFGLVGVPTQSAYCTAKFGVRGFTESLRQEMIIAGHPVTVHCVHPGGVRTNIVRNGRMHTATADEDPAGRFERLARTTPEKAAATILRGVDKNAARILVGLDAYVFAAVPRLLGATYEGLAGRLGRRAQERAARSAG
jgi:NAD(P)-dependent dehydrogenase (short-subunit alcohol dehydrogenase family)